MVFIGRRALDDDVSGIIAQTISHASRDGDGTLLQQRTMRIGKGQSPHVDGNFSLRNECGTIAKCGLLFSRREVW